MQEKAIGCLPLSRADFAPSKAPFVAWLGGAGFLIHAGACNLLLDPCFALDENGCSETGLRPFYAPPLSIANMGSIDAVLYTHSDADHMGLATAKQLLPFAKRFIAPLPCCVELVKNGFPVDKLTLCRPEQEIAVGAMTLHILPADHPWQLLDPESWGEPFREGDCVGYAVHTPEGNALFPGDTRLTARHLRLKDEYNLLALDISQDSYHLGLDGARVLAHHLPAARLLPCHYGTYDAPHLLPQNGSLFAAKQALDKDAPCLLPVKLGEKVPLAGL